MMPDRKDIRFFPIFIGATMGVLLEVIATLVDEIVVGNLFSDEAFASVNLIEPYIQSCLPMCCTAAAMCIFIWGSFPGSRQMCCSHGTLGCIWACLASAWPRSYRC